MASEVLKSSSKQRSENVVTECQSFSEYPAQTRQTPVWSVAVEVDGRGPGAVVLVDGRRSGAVVLIGG